MTAIDFLPLRMNATSKKLRKIKKINRQIKIAAPLSGKYASFLGVDTRSVETTFGLGENKQMCH